MALTSEQFQQLLFNWGAVITAIYPEIDEIPRGAPDSIDSLLSTWRSKVYEKPTAAQLENALLNIVLPAQESERQAKQAKRDSLDDILQRLADSPLADKTPAEIFTIMQGQVDGWGSLAAAKADMRVWFPLMTAAIFWLARRK